MKIGPNVSTLNSGRSDPPTTTDFSTARDCGVSVRLILRPNALGAAVCQRRARPQWVRNFPFWPSTLRRYRAPGRGC
jgi:hypothetical protein